MSSTADKSLSLDPGNPRSHDRIWNLLTLLLLLGTICLVGFFALTFANPTNFLNPFPPAWALLPTPTATPIFPPTWTPTFTPLPRATRTPQPQAGPAVTAVGVVTVESGAPAKQPPAPAGGYPFQLRGNTNQVPSTIIHQEEGCKWMGVAGEVFDIQSSPLVHQVVQLGGRLNRKTINMTSLTGTATQYGPAGYEFSLGDTPMDTNGSLWLQLLDQAGMPLSDRIPINTSSDCQQNLLLVNFKQVR
jgi:hypothetical protein